MKRHTLRQVKQQSGFSIIELMIALVIMAILASLAVPLYQDYSVRAKVGEVFSVIGPLKLAVEDTYVSNGAFLSGAPSCATWSALCTTANGASSMTTKYIQNTFIGPNGVIMVELDSAVIPQLVTDTTNSVVQFVPMTNTHTAIATGYNNGATKSGVIEWKCVGGGFSKTIVDDSNADMTASVGANQLVEAKFLPSECRN